MTSAGFLFFIVISVGFIAIPGPNVLIVISTSIEGGKWKGILAIFGVALAMAIQLFVAAIGTAALVDTLAVGFELLRWFGVAYLFYLAFSHFRSFFSEAAEERSSGNLLSFGKGFFISLTNPKTVIFFSAFLPQFVVGQNSYAAQITILSVTFWLLALFVNLAYAILASHMSGVIASNNLGKFRHGISGTLYFAAGSILAATKKA